MLADASVVILALPAIYREYNAEVADVAWVVTAFNLAIALAAVPAARLATRRPAGQVCAGGLVLFAVASAACALAPVAPVPDRSASRPGHRRSRGGLRGPGAPAGAARARASRRPSAPPCGSGPPPASQARRSGPRSAGCSPQLISWQSIFVAQVPLALIPALVVFGRGAPVVAGAGGAAAHRGQRRARTAVGGSRRRAVPARAAARRGLADVADRRGVRRHGDARRGPRGRAVRAARGESRARARRPARCSGRAASPRSACCPEAGWQWTLAPQILVGAGLALSLGALTEAALAGRSPAAIHGGWTIAARHAGVVLGLVLLTPVFVADLDTQRERATQKGAELVLDARVSALAKIDLAREIANDIKENPGRLPDINRSFDSVGSNDDDRAALLKLEAQLNDQLDRAATSSFERSFLFAALLAGLALIPIALTRRVSL